MKKEIIETLELPIIKFLHKNEDIKQQSKIEICDFNSVKFYSKFYPEIPTEFRMPNNPPISRAVSVNEEVPYLRIFPEETALIPFYFEYTIPGYKLSLKPSPELIFQKGLTLVYDNFSYDEHDEMNYLFVSNYSGSTKKIYSNELIAIGELIKLTQFDIEDIVDG